MTRVILVRHGETYWNLEMKFQGHTNIDLTPKGIDQATKVADRLADEQIAAVYSSDLSRAYKTAEYIARRHNLQVISIPAFREINFGLWEGLLYDGIKEKWPDLLDKLYCFTDELAVPGGESFRQLKERAGNAMEQLVKTHPDQTIAVVSHGGTIRTIICAALNLHLNYLWSLRQDNTAVSIISYYGERTIVDLLNDSHHLRK